MLSGRLPFQSKDETKAAAIMKRIEGNEFSFDGPEWEIVSEEAKEIIQGEIQLSSCTAACFAFGEDASVFQYLIITLHARI